MTAGETLPGPRRRFLRAVWEARYIYLLLLPGIISILIFNYGPMYGLLLAFKKFNAGLGILRSQWIGLAHFRRLLNTPDFANALRNTLIISFSRLIVEFPFPIILGVLLGEMKFQKTKRVLQTVFTFPHFLSWIIVAGILISFLDSNGPVNAVLAALGHGKVNILANTKTFRSLLYATSIWKGAGWSSIIYMAAISGIDPQLYEAAVIDGASRLQRIWHITLPGIKPTIVVLFILSAGRIMNAGFDQIFNLQNAVVRPVSEIIDTYVYRITFEAVPDFGFSTAVGLFKSVINFALLLVTNRLVKAINGSGLFV
ncbi:MAG: ABC transporter permease [Christensenellales bacterium]|jgi:putative aldouronate transport system permease protein